MSRQAPARDAAWLTLQEASERLDVHPATLRQWADRGRVRTFRTPGGHRRFWAEDVRALVSALPTELPAELDLLLNAALGRTRRDLSAGRLAAEPWYRPLDPGTRDRLRHLGRGLLALVVRAMVPGADAGAALAEAGRIGREQGIQAMQAGLTLPEAVRAYTCFRDMLVETVLQMNAVQGHGRPARDPVGPYRQMGALLDEVLVAYLDAFWEPGR